MFLPYFLLPEGKDDAGRISRLCAALVRVAARLDPETVLREVVDGATSGPSAQVELRPTSRLPDGLHFNNKGKSMSKKPETGRNKRYPAYIRQCAGSCAGEILAAAEERTGKLWDVA